MLNPATAKKTRPAAASDEAAARTQTSKPQLLSQLPGTVFTSAGFIMGVVALEFLYGLVLFAMMSTSRRDRPGAEQELYAEAPRVETVLTPRVEATTKAEAGRPEPPKPETAVSNAKAEAGAAKSDRPDTNASATATQAPGKVAQRDGSPSDSAPPKKKKGARTPKKAVALASPSSNSPAAAGSGKSPAQDLPTIPPLGSLIDPLHDSRVSTDGEGLTITVPAGLHVFSAVNNIADAPRALTDVQGDFVAQVKIPGEIRPGTTPIKGLPFIFQGAGLLLWQDKDNYVRFERTAFYTGERVTKVLVESCKGGSQAKSVYRNIREGPISLRMERRGSDLIYTYSPDGKTWLKVGQAAASFPAKLSVGISASNASTRPFPARFEGFLLKPSGSPG